LPLVWPDCGFSGRGARGRLWDPEAEFGFSAEFEGGEFAGAGVVPGEKLPGGFIVSARVQIAEQGGGGEAGGSEVESEIDESIELALRERDVDQAGDGGFGDGDVGGEDGLGLGEGDGVGVMLGQGEAVAEADGMKSDDIGVNAVAESLGFFEQFESGGAEVHVCLQKQKSRSPAFPVGNGSRTAYISKLADPAK
jgi:hypothetical protein